MLDRATRGELPAKPHLVFRDAHGAQYYEHCLTREGFEGPFSILYHQHRPHEAEAVEPLVRIAKPEAASESLPRRRHYRCLDLPLGADLLSARTALLFSSQVALSVTRAEQSAPCYFVNADADELWFVLEGAGELMSPFGRLPYAAGDYVSVPKGVAHRAVFSDKQTLLIVECRRLALPARYRNAVGQLRMDAPYSHRDFRRPLFEGPRDEGIRHTVVQRLGACHGFQSEHSPLDTVGWDGTVYPFALPISAFQPRVGQVHLPPPVHATFEAEGALICSFVPRPLDFHAQANPAPYPHSSVDMDEVLFYANGAFSSRRGISVGSLSHHAAGVPHGPHPDAYETAPGQSYTEEVAVMLDVTAPLAATQAAAGIEDLAYHASFRAQS